MTGLIYRDDTKTKWILLCFDCLFIGLNIELFLYIEEENRHVK